MVDRCGNPSKCEFCGEEFIPKSSRKGGPIQKHCSPSCVSKKYYKTKKRVSEGRKTPLQRARERMGVKVPQ